MITFLPLPGACGLVGVAGAELSHPPPPNNKSNLWMGGGGGSGDGVKEISHPEAWVRGREEDSAPWCWPL